MMMMRRVLIAATLCLAACSGGESANNDSSGGSAAVEPTPDELTVDSENTVVPLDPPGSRRWGRGWRSAPVPAKSPRHSPAGFQGRWGMVSNDCDPQRADAKGLMTISGSRLSFYESRGTASGIRQTQPTQVAFALPMSGEGMTWSEPTTLTLLDDGKTLVRDVTGLPDRAGAFRYSRCPA
jgi:hypothetical protein